LLASLLPVTAGQRAAAAGKKHRVRCQRLIKTSVDYYSMELVKWALLFFATGEASLHI